MAKKELEINEHSDGSANGSLSFSWVVREVKWNPDRGRTHQSPGIIN